MVISLKRLAAPLREVPFDHSLVTAPGSLVRLGVFFDVNFREVAKGYDISLGDFLLRRIPPRGDCGLQSQSRLAGKATFSAG